MLFGKILRCPHANADIKSVDLTRAKAMPGVKATLSFPEVFRQRAARYDGWYGLVHTPESAAARVETLRALRREIGREDAPFEVTLPGRLDAPEEIEAFAAAGVDRLVVSPWRRSGECVEALRRYADRIL